MQVIISIDVQGMQDAIWTMDEMQKYFDENNYTDRTCKVRMSVSDNEYDHSAQVCETCHCPPSQHIKNVPGLISGKPYCQYHQSQCGDMKVVSGL